jgi:alanine dehydrogenase
MLVLTGTDVRELLHLGDCIHAVERVLALHAEGATPAPAVASVHTERGGFHIKSAAADLGRFYFAAKTNGNFPANPSTSGLPTIQGVIVLCDATDGRPLAVMDSAEVTTLRTGAATAVAAKFLARPDSAVATIVGCGVQGVAQLRAIAGVLPLRGVFAVDADEGTARRFATAMTDTIGLPVTVVRDPADAASRSDVIITCTPSRRPLLGPGDLAPGAFVAAVGADHPEKQELDPELFRDATLVVDALDQAAAFGELHHAIAAGVVDAHATPAELGEVVIGARPGRTSARDIVLFDSTGTALEDVAAAALVYERAVRSGCGQPVTLAD